MPDERPYWPPLVPMGIQLNGPDLDEDARMLIGLGAVVRAASAADHTLRMLYCALVGSPYAVVIAAGQMTSQLIKDCRALINVRLDLTPESKIRILSLLNELHQRSERRNRFVHDIWVGGLDGQSELMRSKRGTKDLSLEPITLDQLIDTASGIIGTQIQITRWISEALPQAVGMEARLRLIEAQAREDEVGR
ncbi:hypothetical protein FKR81_32445 [Lentzea tibetensis]|uniref:Uncharacterized protein n=1 Tax=Lentzea tibetensis TaxID=2591470 RepID=A0A563EK49_9PSEU|nr:hypothetical protein [Lentzea tibetensis]TWP47424.1 hypothetical protein FKR81_32445 [Lentzea tibetensis]